MSVSLSDTDTYIIAGAIACAAFLMCTWLAMHFRPCCGKDSDRETSVPWYSTTSPNRHAPKGKKKKKKHKKKKKKKADDYDDIEGGVGGGVGSYGSTTSEAHHTSPPGKIKDRALIDTFKSVLSEGYHVTLHRSTGKPRAVRICIDAEDPTALRWSVVKSITRRQYSLDLSDVTAVEIGTRNFTKNALTSTELPHYEDMCFSLTTQTSSLDIQTTSKMEREAMAQGFTMLTDDIRQRSSSTPAMGDLERAGVMQV